MSPLHHRPRRPAAANNQVVRAHLARKTLPDFLSELEREGAEESGGRRRPGSLVTLSPGDSLAAASAALAAAGVLSAPVIDPSGGGGGGTFRGFFDVADYLRAVVELARERCPGLLLVLPADPSAAASASASAAAAAAAASASAPSSSSSPDLLLPELLLAAASEDKRLVRDCAHAAGEAWFRADDAESSLLDVVVSGFRATAKMGSRMGSSSSSAAFLAAAADPLSRPAHRVAVFAIEKQGGKSGGEGGKNNPSATTTTTTTTTATTTADGPTLSWRIRGVISQTDVVRYIADRSTAEFEPALRNTVAELGFAPGVSAAAAAAAAGAAAPSLPSAGASSSPLVVLPAGTPALAAFAAMVSRRASAVALVDDDEGALLACLTSSDLRGFRGGGEDGEGHFAALLRPAAEVAAAVAAEAEKRAERGGEPYSSSGGIWARGGPLSATAATTEGSATGNWKELLSSATARLVSVAPDATLGEALRKAAAARVHRVWVVEEKSRRPVGVVGLTDMLRVLVQEEDE